MDVVLVANGPFEDVDGPRLRAAFFGGGAAIGVDGGARTLLRLGLTPTHVTGDFDSLSPGELAALAEAGVKIVPTPDQEFTDLDKALSYAFETLGAHRASVFGATGGRLDHLYSALSALVKHGKTRDVRLIDRVGEVFLAGGSVRLDGDDLIGRTVSLLAMGRVDGIKTAGLRWPLTDESLAPGERDGTLNEVIRSPVEISHRSGDLLIYLHHG